MKLRAIIDVRIRSPEGVKTDYKKGDTFKLNNPMNLMRYLKNGFEVVKDGDISQSPTENKETEKTTETDEGASDEEATDPVTLQTTDASTPEVVDAETRKRKNR